MFSMVLALQVSGQLLKMPPAMVLPLHIFVWWVTTAFYTILLDRRFWVATLVFLPAFMWSCVHPAHVFHMMFVVSSSVFLTVAFAWMNPREDAKFFVDRVRERKQQIRSRASRFPKAP